MSIVQEYLDLTQKWKKEYGEKTLVLMQVGSFLEVYALINPNGTYTGSNIEDFSKINEMVIARKNTCVGKLPVVMAGVGVAYVDKYVTKLQEHGYTIVIYKQDINGKNTTRSLSEIISPGTFFPLETDNMLTTDNHSLSNNVMCIWLHKSNLSKLAPAQMTIGIANIDIYTGKTSLFQLVTEYNHNSTTYDELERYISAYRPNECLVVANMSLRLVHDIIGFVGLDTTKIHCIDRTKKETTSNLEVFAQNVEKQVYQTEIMKKFYPHLSADVVVNAFPTHYIATQAFCFLLDFVDQHNPNLVKKLSEPVFENYSDRLILANHSLYQLNIIDDQRHTGKLKSVSSLLNNCVTTMGKRQFMFHIHYPSTDPVLLQRSYDITEYMLHADDSAASTSTKTSTSWSALRNALMTIGDLEKFARKMITRKVTPNNLAGLADNLAVIEALYLNNSKDETLVHYLPKKNVEIKCREIIADLQKVFCIEACRNISDPTENTECIKTGVSATIDELRQASVDGRDKLEAIRQYLSELVQQTEKGSDTKKAAQAQTQQYIKIHETAKNDAVLMGTNRRVNLLKLLIGKMNPIDKEVSLKYTSKFSHKEETFILNLSTLDFTIVGSNKKDLIVTSNQIKDITSENQDSKDKLAQAIQSVFQQYLTTFVRFEEDLHDIIAYTTQLDMLQCKCYIAHKYNYCKPVLAVGPNAVGTNAVGTNAVGPNNNKSFFSFTDIRHPLIEHLQTNELYVTNDLAMGANETNGILLYGTNAVGKTSFIKSVGIAVILAQAGLYVPCSTFIYKPYQNIFTRILGNDNLFKGLSTFAVEMTELRTILAMANKNSLVLGDELCSGTESDSALSIFTAGLEILHEQESTFLFATHFHEIINYSEIKALDKLKMYHMAVQYNMETNVLEYNRKLREGPGESMYGLEVCKALNLPLAFLQRAHDIRMKYNPESRNVLALTSTHFNAQKLVGNCELCKKMKASEVHHLQHQKNAQTTNAYIQTFHKNHVANLLNICEACHQKIHKTGEQHKIIKTSEGYKLTKI